jgi:hypothetical protein
VWKPQADIPFFALWMLKHRLKIISRTQAEDDDSLMRIGKRKRDIISLNKDCALRNAEKVNTQMLFKLIELHSENSFCGIFSFHKVCLRLILFY